MLLTPPLEPTVRIQALSNNRLNSGSIQRILTGMFFGTAHFLSPVEAADATFPTEREAVRLARTVVAPGAPSGESPSSVPPPPPGVGGHLLDECGAIKS